MYLLSLWMQWPIRDLYISHRWRRDPLKTLEFIKHALWLSSALSQMFSSLTTKCRYSVKRDSLGSAVSFIDYNGSFWEIVDVGELTMIWSHWLLHWCWLIQCKYFTYKYNINKIIRNTFKATFNTVIIKTAMTKGTNASGNQFQGVHIAR